jgi:hypothetical protein
MFVAKFRFRQQAVKTPESQVQVGRKFESTINLGRQGRPIEKKKNCHSGSFQ